jgi:hypothetical protein
VNEDKPTILYPFHKRDPLTGKWYRARWKAALDEIERNGWIVDGEPETRSSLGHTSSFKPWHGSPSLPSGDDVELHPHRADPPRIDKTERFLARLFLRRYVTYCIRRARFAQAQGAMALWKELSRAAP